MEAVSEILGIMGAIATTALIIGLIRPSLVVRWGKKRTRGRVLLYYGVGFFALAILASAVEPESVRQERKQKKIKAELKKEAKRKQARLDQERKERKDLERGTKLLSAARTAYKARDYQTAIDSANAAIRALKNVKMLNEAKDLADDAQALLDDAKKGYITKPGTLDRIVERHAHHVFGKSVTWGGEKVPSIMSISISTGYLVDVAYREERVILQEHRRAFITNAREFMERVFTDPACSKVQRIFLLPHYILVDRYGQVSEDQIGKFILDRKVATKIDWRYFSENMFERLLRTEGQFWLHYAFRDQDQ